MQDKNKILGSSKHVATAKPEKASRKRSSAGRSTGLKIKQDFVASIEADLLRRVRAEDGVSRVELARKLNLAPSTIGIYVDRLIAENFLTEQKIAAGEFGRPPKSLALNADGGRFIGVDFEARNIMATAVDFSQKPLRQFHDTIAATDSTDKILAKIEHAICEVMDGDQRTVLGIGVGVPGSINPATGVALHYRHISGWTNIPLVERLQERFGVPVFLENNIRSMALAELWFGEGRGVQNFICIGVRSGIGAGFVIDGHIYHGSKDVAGEIADWPCFSKRTGSMVRLEDVASVRGIQKALGQTNGKFSVEQFIAWAEDGERHASNTLNTIIEGLAQVLSQLNLALNPEKIILAGALPLFGENFIKRLAAQLSQTTDAPCATIVRSTLGDFNGALGAAALAVHEWKPLRR